MSDETVEFNFHCPENVDFAEVSAADGGVEFVEEERPELTGYELVADMMRRQDAVITELDQLNQRIEAAIQEITDARKLDDESVEEFQEEMDEDLQLRTAA